MKKIILYVWQLPQNLLGLLVILFTRAKHQNCCYVANSKRYFGVSLGNYIIFGTGYWGYSKKDLLHEMGHQKQSLYLGPLYLIIIGLPSFCGNIFDRVFHKKWLSARRIKWYYSQPWEKWADKLGGVKRWN